jgi:RsiW-degrading membrane proteinase PrsW (M82 family)
MTAPASSASTPSPSADAARAPESFFLVCIAGADRGKRVRVDTHAARIGSTPECNVLTDDPDVVGPFASVQLVGNQVRIEALASTLLYVDGHPVATASLGAWQQVRMGRSLWEVHATVGASSVFDFVNRLGDHLSNAAGIEKPAEWSAREMFTDAAKRHADEEIEAHFTVGTTFTTPSLAEIDTRWPRPWVFLRVCALSLALYYGFLFAWDTFQNLNLLPGLIMIGSVAVPLSLLIFFFEVNVPRNISLYQVLRLLLTGGLVSLIVSLFLFSWTGSLSNWLGAASAGIVEETGKVLTLLLVVRKPRFRWTLNGLLLGATVGTGFEVFESAGYAFRAAIGDGGIAAMRDMIFSRGALSVFGGHVVWTGLAGAALWRVRDDQPFRREMLIDPRFLRVLGICMVMHMLWNSPFALPVVGVMGKYAALGAAAWLLALGTIQGGLRQIRDAQGREAMRRTGATEINGPAA